MGRALNRRCCLAVRAAGAEVCLNILMIWSLSISEKVNEDERGRGEEKGKRLNMERLMSMGMSVNRLNK